MKRHNQPFVVLVLTVMAMFVAIAAAGLPLVWVAQLEDAMANKRTLLDTLARANRGGSTAIGLPSPRDPLISSDSVGRSGALLQLKIDELAAVDGIVVRSVQVLTPRREGDVTHILVAVTLQSDTAALRKFFHTLETSFPLLVVDELSIRSLATAPRAAASAMPLEVSLVVRGLAAQREGP